MKKKNVGKAMVVGIIMLVVGASVVPITGAIHMEKNSDISCSYTNSPFDIKLSISGTMKLNENIQFISTVTSSENVKNSKIKIILPNNINHIAGELEWRGTLTADYSKMISNIIKIDEPGEYSIYVYAFDDDGIYSENVKVIYLYASEDEIIERDFPIFTLMGADENVMMTNEKMKVEEPIEIDEGSDNSYIMSPGVTIDGNWYYNNQDNSGMEDIRYCIVELWVEILFVEIKVATTYTNSNGYYQFTGVTTGFPYQVRCISETHSSSGHNAVKLTNGAGGHYMMTTPWTVINDDTYFGYTCVDALRGLFEIINFCIEGFDFVKDNGGYSRPQIEAVFPFESWPHSHGDSIHIPSGWEWSTATIHEYGHCVQWKIYGNKWPPSPNIGASHSMATELDGGFALCEGWAEFFEFIVTGDDQVEDTVWADANDFGDWDGNDVEGAVAAILWDIGDGVDSNDFPLWSFSQYGDYVNNQFSRIWTIMYNDNPDDMNDFWNNWDSRYGCGSEIWGVYYNQRVWKDSTDPSNPDSWVSSPSYNIWTNDNTIYVDWWGASDDLSGVHGYGLLWASTSSEPAEIVDVTHSYTTSSALSDGTWYLTIKSVDRAGNWASSYLSVGPFYIDTVSPEKPIISSSTHSIQDNWYSNNDPSFSWTTPLDPVPSSGLNCYAYALDQSPSTVPTVLIAGNSKSYTDIADGIWWFHVLAIDNAGNWGEPDHYQIKIDTTPPMITIENPSPLEEVQGVITFSSFITDLSGVDWVEYCVRYPGGAQGIIINPTFESLIPSYVATDRWQLAFDTMQLLDGYYVLLVTASDILGQEAYKTVTFCIRNWEVSSLIPPSQKFKAGRTVPIKFSLRVKAAVDPLQPFVVSEELTIKIYEKGDPGTILQTSIFGDKATDYRINTIEELYITNFKTLKTPMSYVVDIWRFDLLLSSFEFETVGHMWSEQGTYTITAKAKDVFDAEGPEGTLSVSMPRNRAITSPFLNFLQQYPILYQLLQRFLRL